VGLADEAAGRQRCAAVEHTDVVESEKAALENVVALSILAIHPPGELQAQLVQDALEEGEVALIAPLLSIDLEDAQRAPGMHWLIDVAERPFVGRYLAIRVHVPLPRQQHELLFGELRVDQRQRDRVEGEIPGGVPGYSHLSGIEMTS